MEKYDPYNSPNPVEWLELDEDDKISRARTYHERMRADISHFATHASLHVIVENQLAEGLKEARHALQRLMADGLDRHDAIRAISSVLIEHLAYVTRKNASDRKATKRYKKRLKSLTVDNWMAFAD